MRFWSVDYLDHMLKQDVVTARAAMLDCNILGMLFTQSMPFILLPLPYYDLLLLARTVYNTLVACMQVCNRVQQGTSEASPHACDIIV